MDSLSDLNTNFDALNTLYNLNNIDSQISMSMQQISTGKAVNTPADDPAGFAIGQADQVKINSEQAAESNIQDASSLLQVAQTQQGNAQNMLEDITSDLQSAVSGTIGSTDRSAINTKLQQYIDEINNIASQTTFNGVKLLSASSTTIVVQVGQTGKDLLTAVVSGVTAKTLGLSGLSCTTQSAASAALSAVQKAVSNLTDAQENIGARISRLSDKLNALSTDVLNTQSAQANTVDANVAQQEVQYTKYQVFQQAALAVLGQANVAPEALLKLLP